MTDQDNTNLDLNSSEFQDYDGPLFPESAGYDLSRLFAPASLRGLAAIVVAILIIRVPSQSPKATAILIAIILGAWSIGSIAEMRRIDDKTSLSRARVLALIASAIGLLFWPNFTAAQLGRLAGTILIIGGAVAAYRTIRHQPKGGRFEPMVGATLYLALGAALMVAPQTLLGLAILGLSIYWFLAGVLTVVTNVRADDRELSPSNTLQSFLEWVQTRPNTADDRLQLYDKIFYEGEVASRRLSRFFALMGFATAIAAFGIIADSTAVVIGAMLVAPLMTPLMGTSLSMVMGWPRRVAISGLVALGGIALAIGLSILFGWIYSVEISPELNSQVASRIAPTLVDLVIAIAAGGAGAFALSRPDVSDSLPGVAVAIALVPPLAVIGLMISQGNWFEAVGALTLFTTNLVAILLVGAGVFVMTGVVPLFQIINNSRAIKLSLGMVATLAVAIVAVLGVSTESFQAEITGTATATEAVENWKGDADLEVITMKLSPSELTLTVAGPEPPPPAEELADEVARLSGDEVDVAVLWVPQSAFEYDNPSNN